MDIQYTKPKSDQNLPWVYFQTLKPSQTRLYTTKIHPNRVQLGRLPAN